MSVDRELRELIHSLGEYGIYLSTLEVLEPEKVEKYVEEYESLQKGVSKTLEVLIKNSVITPLSNMLENIRKDLQDVSKLIFEGRVGDAVVKLIPYITSSMMLSLTLDLLQTSVFGFSVNLRKTIDKIDRLVNPELIISTLIGVMVGSGVETPAKYLFNSLFTPVLPDIRTLAIGYFKGYYSEGELKRYLEFLGFNSRWHNLLIDLNDFTPSVPFIERITRYYPVPKEVLIDWLKENGVREGEIEFWLKYFEYSAIRDELSKYETVIRDLYINGYISDKELDKYLEVLKVNPMERNLVKDMWLMLKMKKVYSYYVDKNLYLFRRGIIDTKTLLDRLSKFIVDVDIVEGIAMVELAKMGIDYKGRLE